MMKVANEFGLTWEDIDHDSACLASVLSLETYLQIVDLYGGGALYIPTRETLERPLKLARMRKEFNGYNAKTLARKYGLSESRFRTIMREGR